MILKEDKEEIDTQVIVNSLGRYCNISSNKIWKGTGSLLIISILRYYSLSAMLINGFIYWIFVGEFSKVSLSFDGKRLKNVFVNLNIS